jgi:hypothetical protein
MLAALTVGKAWALETSEPRDRSDGLLGGGGGFLLSPSPSDESQVTSIQPKITKAVGR